MELTKVDSFVALFDQLASCTGDSQESKAAVAKFKDDLAILQAETAEFWSKKVQDQEDFIKYKQELNRQLGCEEETDHQENLKSNQPTQPYVNRYSVSEDAPVKLPAEDIDWKKQSQLLLHKWTEDRRYWKYMKDNMEKDYALKLEEVEKGQKMQTKQFKKLVKILAQELLPSATQRNDTTETGVQCDLLIGKEYEPVDQ